jgi:organic radical activating enzyme
MDRIMPFVRIEGDKIRSLKIEYNLTDHCNYGCDECSHFSPYLTRKESSLEGFKKDLEALAQVIRVFRFRFVGGEPLLHRDILGHIAAVRESGIAGEVQICTNGALLDRVPEAVFAAIDSLSISWYPDPRCDQAKVDRAVSICERVGTRVGVHKIDTFRQMQVGRPLTDRALVQEVYDSCHIAHRWYCQTFYEGRFYLCSRPIFTNAYLAKLGVEAPDFRELDGIPLHEPDLKGRLLALLRSHKPLAACEYCLGTVGRRQPWRQLPTTDRKAPRAPAKGPTELIDRQHLMRQRISRWLPLRSMLLLAPRPFVAWALPYLSPSL